MQMVRRGERSCCLLEGKEHAAVAKALRQGRAPASVVGKLSLKRVRPSSSSSCWDEFSDCMYLVMDQEWMLRRCTEEEEEEPVVVVDVSPQLSEARIDDGTARLQTQIDAVRVALLEDRGMDLLGEDGVFDVALLGWLLGFPVVLRSDASSSSGRTCLDDQPVCIATVCSSSSSASASSFFSFSIPQNVLHDARVERSLAAARARWTELGLVCSLQCGIVLDRVTM